MYSDLKSFNTDTENEIYQREAFIVEYDFFTCTLIFLISFTGYFVKGIAGFGDPLITAPLMSLFLNNQLISSNSLLLSLPLNGRIAWKNRDAFSIKPLLPILFFMMLGIIPGTLLLKYAESNMIKAFLGILVIGLGVEMLTRDRAKPLKKNNAAMAVVNFISGVTSGVYGINLFFVAYQERTSKGRDEFRSSICFVFFLENIYRLIVYIASGVLNTGILWLTAVSAPGMVLGFIAGSRVDRRLSEKTIRSIVIFLFILGGTSILIRSLI